MIEVFKTTIKNQEQADSLLSIIRRAFPASKVNVDLEDCDKILRMEYPAKAIEPAKVISLASEAGFDIEVLSDEVRSPVHH